MADNALDPQLVLNSINLARQALAARAGQMYENERDTWKILGYKKTLDFRDYLALYERGDVAGRIVDMPVQETWRTTPTIVNPETGDEFDEFEDFSTRVKLFSHLEKVDRISGIGRFGVLFIGTADNDLSSPIQPGSLESLDDILYLKAYHEGRAEVIQWESDHTEPRFGMPLLYRVKLAEFTDSKGISRASVGDTPKTMVEERVHWTRLVHVAEDPLQDPIYGRPRLQRAFNRLFDLLKISGGSAEMFWQNVAQIFHVNLDPELEYKDEDLKDLNDKILEMLQGIRRVIQTQGIDNIDPLQGKTPDPRGVFYVLSSLVSAAAEIPQRLLFGSEQGELASSQDQSEWYGRITRRRTRHVEPNLIDAIIDRLAFLGATSLTPRGYVVRWPSLFEETPQDRAVMARAASTAAEKIRPDAPHLIVTENEMREFLGLPSRPEGEFRNPPILGEETSGIDNPDGQDAESQGSPSNNGDEEE